MTNISIPPEYFIIGFEEGMMHLIKKYSYKQALKQRFLFSRHLKLKRVKQ